MVSQEPVLLIVAADRREFDGWEVDRWPVPWVDLGSRWSRCGTVGGKRAVLVANGPGKKNALHAVEKVSERVPVGAVVSTGFVGGLNPELTVGQLFLAGSVLEFGRKVEYSVRLPECAESAATGRLITVDSVVQSAGAKAELHKLGADAVDMEAVALAEFSQARQLPFYCVRAVSDDARTSFEVDLNATRRPDGTFSGWKIVAQAGLSRRRWRHLMDLKRASEVASRNLAAFLQRCSFEF